MPVELIARRGLDTLRFGPMRPVGLVDPRNNQRAWAIVQLRQENQEGTIYGMVGFQTRLRWTEQDRIFRMIPGLEEAEFVRYGVMHRNTYINSPRLLSPTLQTKINPRLFFVLDQEPLVFSSVTMTGALIDFITSSNSDSFQPMNANFGILPALEDKIKDKKTRYQKYVDRSQLEMCKISELFLEHVVKEL
jgi:methylenetetrahydrofolate--tRNA-(uracil-5-)-methyltransferase